MKARPRRIHLIPLGKVTALCGINVHDGETVRNVVCNNCKRIAAKHYSDEDVFLATFGFKSNIFVNGTVLMGGSSNSTASTYGFNVTLTTTTTAGNALQYVTTNGRLKAA